MRRWLFVAFVILGVPATGSAALIDLGQVTRDTDLNGGLALEWLDMGVTRGRSFNDVSTDATLAAEGWRYGTVAEVLTLLTHSGYPIVPNETGPNGQVNDDPLAYAGMLAFLQLIDARIFVGTPTSLEQLRADGDAMTADVVAGSPGWRRMIYAMAWDLNPLAYGGREQTSTIFVQARRETYTSEFGNPNQSWLVRETAATTAAVPEPATLGLLGAGLAVAAVQRFSRARH